MTEAFERWVSLRTMVVMWFIAASSEAWGDGYVVAPWVWGVVAIVLIVVFTVREKRKYEASR